MHMRVDLTTLLECRQADPTYMRLAPHAGHVVATSFALDRCLAAGTVLDVVAALPLLEERTIARLIALARRMLVVLGIALRADA